MYIVAVLKAQKFIPAKHSLDQIKFPYILKRNQFYTNIIFKQKPSFKDYTRN